MVQRIPGFLSSLLSRFAENIYWLGRYLERAENTARILHVNETYARDDPQGPGWEHVLDIFADRARFNASHVRADTQSVLNFYALDAANPTSIYFCVNAARENARSIRHLISTEMWTQINLFHSSMRALTASDIALSNLSRLASKLILDCQTFEGVAEGTLLRGEPWCFYHMGKYLERADQTTRVLDIGYQRLPIADVDALSSVQWHALLRSVSGYHAFRGRHPSASGPTDIVQFLLYDTEFPRAVLLCVERLSERLLDVERRHGVGREQFVEEARRRLEYALKTGPGDELTAEQLHAFLDDTQVALASVSDAISKTYFQ